MSRFEGRALHRGESSRLPIRQWAPRSVQGPTPKRVLRPVPKPAPKPTSNPARQEQQP